MYVAPRPRYRDDPLFAVRLATAAVVGFVVAVFLQATLPVLIPALTVGLMAGMRKAFDPKKAIGGPIALIAMIAAMALIVELTRPMPAVFLLVMGLFAFVAYFLILRTGNPIGMLVAIAMVLMSVMGMNSLAAMAYMRDGFIQAALCAMVIIPVLYLLVPPVATEKFVEEYIPAPGEQHVRQAIVRAFVLVLVALWLYTVLDASNLILGIGAIFVLTYPTRRKVFAEAYERVVATAIGGGMALLILWLFTWAAHLPVLLGLIFLAGMFLASRMMDGIHPPMVYQFAFSVMVALIAGALSTQAPVDATLSRIGLTLAGALTAAIMTTLIEAVVLKKETGLAR
jgi:MFS family permease